MDGTTSPENYFYFQVENILDHQNNVGSIGLTILIQ